MRDHIIMIKVSKQEKELLLKKAGERRLKLSSYCRMKLFDKFFLSMDEWAQELEKWRQRTKA